MKKLKSKIPQVLKQAVIDSFKRHAWNMGVSNYVVDIYYKEKDKESIEGDIMADINVDRRYLRAALNIYPAFIKKWEEIGNDFIEDSIAHETAHILVAHLQFLATACYKDEGEVTDAIESLTELISRISVKLDKLNRKHYEKD